MMNEPKPPPEAGASPPSPLTKWRLCDARDQIRDDHAEVYLASEVEATALFGRWVAANLRADRAEAERDAARVELQRLQTDLLRATPTFQPSACTCWIGRGELGGSDRHTCQIHNESAMISAQAQQAGPTDLLRDSPWNGWVRDETASREGRDGGVSPDPKK
jgi:hypothetical protein